MMQFPVNDIIILKANGTDGVLDPIKKVDATCSNIVSPLHERNQVIYGAIIWASIQTFLLYDVSNDSAKFYKITNNIKPVYVTHDQIGR